MGGGFRREGTYVYLWLIMMMNGRGQHSIVKQLSSNKQQQKILNARSLHSSLQVMLETCWQNPTTACKQKPRSASLSLCSCRKPGADSTRKAFFGSVPSPTEASPWSVLSFTQTFLQAPESAWVHRRAGKRGPACDDRSHMGKARRGPISWPRARAELTWNITPTW